MKRLKKQIKWEDAHGNNHDIRTISDDYLGNIISWLSRRMTSFTDLEESSAVSRSAHTTQALVDEINEMDDTIELLLKEMGRRKKKKIFIPHDKGSENRHSNECIKLDKIYF